MKSISSFQGFSPETGIYLRELAIHNYRSWFEDNKNLFVQCLKVPFESLAHDTFRLMTQENDKLDFSLHISRIYRDARRLYGKGPYKDHLWFSIKANNSRDDGADFYFEIGPFKWSYGLGYWGQAPSVMASLRKYIDSHPEEIRRELLSIQKHDIFTIGGEYYARPKGHADDELGALYNAKSVWIAIDLPYNEELYSTELPYTITRNFKELMPLYNHLIIASTL